MRDNYESERVPEYSTLGDSYRHCNSAPQAFAAGAQYALDRIVGMADRGELLSADAIRSAATETLRRAKAGEPQ